MTSKQMFTLINKLNFILSSRHSDEAVLNARRGGVTKKLDKICLPSGNLDFAQSLRYVSSKYMPTFSSTSLDIGQNQDFNLGKIFI